MHLIHHGEVLLTCQTNPGLRDDIKSNWQLGSCHLLVNVRQFKKVMLKGTAFHEQNRLQMHFVIVSKFFLCPWHKHLLLLSFLTRCMGCFMYVLWRCVFPLSPLSPTTLSSGLDYQTVFLHKERGVA